MLNSMISEHQITIRCRIEKKINIFSQWSLLIVIRNRNIVQTIQLRPMQKTAGMTID